MWIKNGNRYSIQRLRRDNPNTSFPEKPIEALLNAFGVYRATETAQPSYDPATEKLVEGFSDAGGSWEQTWTVVPKTQQEQDDYRDWRKLTPQQFEYMIEESGLRTAFEALIADLKTSGQDNLAARIKGGLRRDEYRLGWWLDVFAQVRPRLQTLFPQADMSDTRIINLWYAAEQVEL